MSVDHSSETRRLLAEGRWLQRRLARVDRDMRQAISQARQAVHQSAHARVRSWAVTATMERGHAADTSVMAPRAELETYLSPPKHRATD